MINSNFQIASWNGTKSVLKTTDCLFRYQSMLDADSYFLLRQLDLLTLISQILWGMIVFGDWERLGLYSHNHAKRYSTEKVRIFKVKTRLINLRKKEVKWFFGKKFYIEIVFLYFRDLLWWNFCMNCWKRIRLYRSNHICKFKGNKFAYWKSLALY